MKSENLKFLEPSEPLQALTGLIYPFYEIKEGGKIENIKKIGFYWINFCIVNEYNLGSIFKIEYSFCLWELPIYRKRIYKLMSYLAENTVCLH